MRMYEGKTALPLRVNGEARAVLARPSDLLLDALRDQLGLMGTKFGCLNGDCGACTVLLDGVPVKSCLVLAVEAEGHDVMTVEGLPGDAPVKRAFIEESAFQCGYCTSGFLLVCHALSQNHPDAGEYEIERWLESNLCRCTSYQELRGAVERALGAARINPSIPPPGAGA